MADLYVNGKKAGTASLGNGDDMPSTSSRLAFNASKPAIRFIKGSVNGETTFNSAVLQQNTLKRKLTECDPLLEGFTDLSITNLKRDPIQNCDLNKVKILTPVNVSTVAADQENLTTDEEYLDLIRKNRAHATLGMRMHPSVPKKVPILTLNDMTFEEIEATFNLYNDRLDAVLHDLKPMPFVYGYQGVNRFKVMPLISMEVNLQMIQKLGSNYRTRFINYPTHIANALVPEWLLCIFMAKYNFTREEALQQLQDQDVYQAYLISKEDELGNINLYS